MQKFLPMQKWSLKGTPRATLMVLDSNRNALNAGPQVKEDRFFANGDCAEKRRKANDYCKSRLTR
jgi:hypothetical protein